LWVGYVVVAFCPECKFIGGQGDNLSHPMNN
jgi:hypothetical protein